MKKGMKTYYYNAVSAAGFATSQMIWWMRSIDRTEAFTNET